MYFPQGVDEAARNDADSDAQKLLLSFKRFVFDKGAKVQS